MKNSLSKIFREWVIGDLLEAKIPNLIKCENCRCWLERKDAQIISVYSEVFNFEEYYCRKCKQPYSEVKLFSYSDIPNKYFKKIEVTEDGEPVGYKKIKHEKQLKK